MRVFDMNITVNGKEVNLYRTESRSHGFIDLFIGESCAEKRISVPVHIYEHGGSVFTSGNKIAIKLGATA
jgi:hypothetical protein